MKPPKCKLCGSEHYGVDHVWPASNEPKVASNRVDSASNKVATASNSKQRWGRDAYNAYQRDLMRKRRARAA